LLPVREVMTPILKVLFSGPFEHPAQNKTAEIANENRRNRGEDRFISSSL